MILFLGLYGKTRNSIHILVDAALYFHPQPLGMLQLYSLVNSIKIKVKDLQKNEFKNYYRLIYLFQGKS